MLENKIRIKLLKLLEAFVGGNIKAADFEREYIDQFRYIRDNLKWELDISGSENEIVGAFFVSRVEGEILTHLFEACDDFCDDPNIFNSEQNITAEDLRKIAKEVLIKLNSLFRRH